MPRTSLAPRGSLTTSKKLTINLSSLKENKRVFESNAVKSVAPKEAKSFVEKIDQCKSYVLPPAPKSGN